jgi:hypothetical protein
MNITRKNFMKGAGAAALGIMLPELSHPLPVDAASLPDLVPGNLPDTEELWKWLQQLAGWCPAYTGSPGHVNFVNFLDAELRRSKLEPLRKTYTLPRWDLKEYGIKVGSEEIHAASYRPFSGSTGPSGVSAPLYYAGMGDKLDYSGAAGKIVLIEMPPALDRSGGALVGDLVGTYPAHTPLPNVRYGVIGVYRLTPDIRPLEKAGAAGAIYIWNNVSDGNAEDQALPFSSPSSSVPALWVNATQGKRLKQLAASGASARLTLNAVSHPDTPTDNLWAVLPGKTDETIIINTHTDGCNACEENGALGVVALARYFSRIPQAQRNRTLVFLMTTGHFGHGYVRGAQDWRDSNRDLMKKAVACVTIEHLGANEWVDNAAANEYKPTGQFDWGVAYTPLRAEGQVFLDAVEGTEARNTYAFKPQGSYPGEGAGFWAAGIPTISYIPSPQFLFIAPAKGGGLEKLDKRRLHGEVTTMARCVAALDKMTIAEIKGANG